jgi:hypothetical protein
MSWIRTSLQLEYSIPRRQLFVFIREPEPPPDTSLIGRMMPSGPGYISFPLHEDRTFPPDPWRPASHREHP